MDQLLPGVFLYRQNPSRTAAYDLIRAKGENPIPYFILSQPKDSRFKHQGAVLILESWTNGGKSIFTGLVPLVGAGNVLYGDHLNGISGKSLLCLVQDGDTFEMHYFNGFYPRSHKRCRAFLLTYFQTQAMMAI